jgi:hypothetical protein
MNSHFNSFQFAAARYALGVGERCGEWLANEWRTIPPLRVRPHQQLALSSSALPHEPINQVLSCEAPKREVSPLSRSVMLSMWLTQPISAPLQSGIRFLPHLLSAPPSVHLAMHFPLTGSDVDLPCSVGMTR